MDLYPSVRYKEGKEPVTVNNEKEDKALGPGWFNTPDPEAQKSQSAKGQPKNVVSYGNNTSGPERRLAKGVAPKTPQNPDGKERRAAK